ELEFLARSPMRHMTAADVQRKSALAAAKDALAHIHADAREFVIHLDTDIISNTDFPAVNVPAEGGLPLADVHAALAEAARSKNLVGLTISQYNPDKAPDPSAARKLVDFLVDALSVRLESPPEPATETVTQPPSSDSPESTEQASRSSGGFCPGFPAPPRGGMPRESAFPLLVVHPARQGLTPAAWSSDKRRH